MATYGDGTFQHIVGVILNNWTGLKMAIEHGMVNPGDVEKKIVTLINSIMDFLSTAEIKSDWDHYALADCLSDTMDIDFDTILEDDSCDEIAVEIIQLYQLWLSGQHNEMNARLHNLHHKTCIIPNRTCSEKNEISHKAAENITEADEITEDVADGWTMVKRR